MKWKQLLLILVFVFHIFDAYSQSIVVKSFRKVVEATRKDATPNFLNNSSRPKCTLIKVLTDQPGFVLDFGPIGTVLPSEQREGQKYYLIPVGAKSVTISNKQFGIACNYSFGTDLEEWIYEMVLKADSTITSKGEQIKTQWVTIKSFPFNAKIYIDGYNNGVTPYNGSLTIGTHKVKIVNNGTIVEQNITITEENRRTVRMVFEAEDYKNMEALKVVNLEQVPEFRGGIEAFHKFINENMQSPALLSDSDIQGTVFIQFIVSETGRVSNVKVLRGIGGGCDEEAILLVKMMPDWIPARANGKAVPCMFQVPIKFNYLEN